MRVGRSVSWTSVLILTFVFIQIEGYVIGVRNKGFQTREISSLLLSSSSLNQPRMESDEDNPLLIVCRLDKIGLDHSAKTRLVLASQSPRRREILDMMMLKGKYTVKIPPLDESKVQRELAEDGVCPEVYTRKLAEAKAFALAEHDLAHNSTDEAKVPTFYLGSDTVVEIDDKILEKPKDPEEARQMLTLMSGRQHHVHTGVALYRLLENDISLISSFTDTATVTFCKLSSETIDAYVATGEPLDKAGKCYYSCAAYYTAN